MKTLSQPWRALREVRGGTSRTEVGNSQAEANASFRRKRTQRAHGRGGDRVLQRQFCDHAQVSHARYWSRYPAKVRPDTRKARSTGSGVSSLTGPDQAS
ncbi:hypothetical protein M2189_006212 [Bradyrhizobium japonicum]|uniref:hypothetical protein n=1 Tax=Bradyrhizobium japonicum TaxID=375 RepID=UPI0021699312|nr:hypothetical protein [Bradyrhizobium japonicum]MCS3494831.1 hypothetical protein [Bradyrhizobium japonicum]MCS3963009.1 hypothetical protein [Bradyrhizobium japonicum]MCS3995322.1 hypothetical protein [Bradyrhizobium japonicum]